MSRILLGAVLGAVVFAAPAQAQSIEVPAGKTTMIDFVGSFNMKTCTHGACPRVKLNGAANGKITTKWTSITLNQRQVGPAARRCSGHRMKGMAIYYTPDRGFRGTDRVSFGFSYDRGDGRRNNSGRALRVNVR